jgi:NADH dehydrogenase FAD-containing subunit
MTSLVILGGGFAGVSTSRATKLGTSSYTACHLTSETPHGEAPLKN